MKPTVEDIGCICEYTPCRCIVPRLEGVEWTFADLMKISKRIGKPIDIGACLPVANDQK